MNLRIPFSTQFKFACVDLSLLTNFLPKSSSTGSRQGLQPRHWRIIIGTYVRLTDKASGLALRRCHQYSLTAESGGGHQNNVGRKGQLSPSWRHLSNLQVMNPTAFDCYPEPIFYRKEQDERATRHSADNEAPVPSTVVPTALISALVLTRT